MFPRDAPASENARAGHDERAARLEHAARALLFATMVALPIQRWPLVRVGGAAVLLTDVLLASSYVLAFAAWLVGRAQRRVDRRALAAALGYAAVLGISVAASHGPLRHYAKLVAYLPFLLSPVLVTYLLRDTRTVARGVDALAAAAGIAIAVGAATVVAFYVAPSFTREALMCGYGAFPAGNYPRLCAPFPMQNGLAGFYVATLPFVLAAVLRRWGTIASVGLAAFASVVMAFTLSAGVGAFAVAAVFVLAPALRAMRGGSVLAPLAWAAALAVQVASVLVSVGSLVPAGRGDVSCFGHDYLFWDGSRPSILNAGFATVAHHPLLGIGYGERVAHVTDLRSFVSHDAIASWTGPAYADLEAHDLWLSVAGQAGLLGLGAFVWLLVVLVGPVVRMRSAATDALARRAVLASLLGGIGLHGLFTSNEEQRHFFLVCGLGLALARAATVADPPERPHIERAPNGDPA